jgi:hypothetical protein
MIHPEAHSPVRDIPDYEGDDHATVYRSLDTLVIPAITIGLDGIRETRKALDEGEAGILAYRFRTADLGGIDMDEVCDRLASLGFGPDPAAADWAEVGQRLGLLKYMGGWGELRKLHALLSGTGTPEIAGDEDEPAPLCNYCDVEPAVTQAGYCEACAPAAGLASGTPDDDEAGPTYGAAELRRADAYRDREGADLD